MEKKNKVKTLSKIMLVLVFVMSMAINFMKPVKINATGDNKTIVIGVNVADSSDVTLAALGPENVVLEPGNEGGNLKGYRGDSETFIDFENTTTGVRLSAQSMSVVCADNKHCNVTLTVPEDDGVRIVTAGGTPFAFQIGGAPYGGENENITGNANVQVVNRDNASEGFDGKAYLIWSCENGGVCYHYFDDIPATVDDVFFIKASTIDDYNTGEIFRVDAETKAFALKNDFEEWQDAYKTFNNLTDIDWQQVDISDLVGPVDMRENEELAVEAGACSQEGVDEDTFHNCVDDYTMNTLGKFIKRADLQPVGEPMANNAYVSYGDRNFKAIIYNDDYRGVTLGDFSDLEYYVPAMVDPFMRTDSYDVSATTKTNPVEIDSMLLEKTINIKALSAYNGFEIESIEPLDVPADAVSVTKGTNDEFKIRFSSNFYDKVVFKVTSTNQETYYMRINRISVTADLHYRDNKPVIDANLYFDRIKSYSDFSVKTKIVYKDGTTKSFIMKNARRVDDMLGQVVYDYEKDLQTYGNEDTPKGKGLKQATYSYSLASGEEERISKIYINVEYTGSTKSNYAGAFTGSGKGVELEMGR